MDRPIVRCFLLCVALVVVPADRASAVSISGGPSLLGQDPSSQSCYFSTAHAVKPAANGMSVDMKAFIYKKVRSSTSGCSFAAAGKAFSSAESFVRAILYRTSDLTICTATSYGSTPSG